ncbi:hypothetical protein C9439_01095 [archaeon SCG-AAA382B04]|nr:hypothetical protein C9439_01095 [archaeon SCG-AAA382B04]
MITQEVMNEDWDYLVVLDACRYDVFKQTYSDYLSGSLEKRKSKGSSTLDWLFNNFTERYDVNYFSANPYINSLGISLDETKWGASCGYDWTAKDHFNEIIDIWEHGWNDELGTVHPTEMNKKVLDYSDKLNDRSIIHYMQPHSPFISNGKPRKLKRIRKGLKQKQDTNDARLIEKIRKLLESKLISNRVVMKIGMLLNLEISDIFSSMRPDRLRQKLMKYYRQNLELALESVVKLIEKIDGKIVVTADHGEAFGEHGVWEHHIETYIPQLTNVPWLVVQN